jgi:hypothetical protein
MEILDLKKNLKHLYAPSAKEVTEVAVPRIQYLMIDGTGDPNTTPAYTETVEALYAVAYTIKFAIKKGRAIDYPVLPLEGLWWMDDMREFSMENKNRWKWTMMIAQPDLVGVADVHSAVAEVKKKKNPPALPLLRFDTLDEGDCAQIMHIGPYADEKPTIQKLHDFIAARGASLSGKHHEIYLGDPRRTAPEKLKTVIRQPFTNR